MLLRLQNKEVRSRLTILRTQLLSALWAKRLVSVAKPSWQRRSWEFARRHPELVLAASVLAGDDSVTAIGVGYESLVFRNGDSVIKAAHRSMFMRSERKFCSANSE